jgi:hypothetical protein
MKKNLLIIASILIVLTSYSQDDFQTIFGGDVTISGYGGPMMSFTSLNGDFAHMMGGGGGVLISKSFFFGGFGLGNSTYHTFDYTNPHTNIQSFDMDLDISYGGLSFGYIIAPNKPIHPAVYLQTGWGDVVLSENGTNRNSDNIFVLNPSVQMEINMTRFFRIGVGVNYQYVNGVNLNGLSNEDFSYPGGFLSFKFGWFN